MFAIDVMASHNAAIASGSSIEEALRLMSEHGRSALVVTDGQSIVGVLIQEAFLKRAELDTAHRPQPWWDEFFSSSHTIANRYIKSNSKVVADLMEERVSKVTPLTPLRTVIAQLERNPTRCVAVVDGGELSGAITPGDIVSAMAKRSASRLRLQRSDDAIGNQVAYEMAKQLWMISKSTRLSVRRGIVRFEGTFRCETERQASNVLAANVPGVVDIADFRVFEASPILAV